MNSSLIIPILGVVVALGYFGLTGGFGSPSPQKTYGGKNRSRRNRHKTQKRGRSMKHKK